MILGNPASRKLAAAGLSQLFLEKSMNRIFRMVLLALLLGVVGARAGAMLPEGVDIPFKKFKLANGLTLIVHEDHKAPIVAVNVWYHVGSKNERPGRTGFAHLFEHLMFNGSENYNDDFFKVLEGIGATDLNGTTNEDRTNYFENVPRNALDIVLWMESDRMGHFVGAISQERLDEQRGVVQNEKRQGENQPYGQVDELITKATFPAGHPYSWTTIGSMEDLNAASLDDVKEWFKTYYGAANATLVVAGDVQAEEVRQKVEAYFGDIPSGPPLSRFQKWVAKRSGSQRATLEDRVPQARVYKVWNTPGFGEPEAELLDLLARILTSGRNSRLAKKLVYELQLASNVNASQNWREIAGQFQIMATARPGVELAAIERVIDQEMAELLASGPTPEELRRAQVESVAESIRGVERIGGFGGKSDVLAMGEVYAGDPAFYKISQTRTLEATAEQVRDAARAWLSDGVYTLEVLPHPEHTTTESKVDRSKLPEMGPAPEVDFPTIERSTLSNGLKIYLAERHSVPTVSLNLMLNAGYASDQHGVPGMAKLAMGMLDEGTATRTAEQISDELAGLGANLASGSDLDFSHVFLNALKANLDASLEVFADVILHPSFPEGDFQRNRKLQIDAIRREKVQPFGMALRVLPGLLYGQGHAYSLPFTGSGFEAGVAGISLESVRKFHADWFKPNHATLIVVGDTTMAEIKPKLEALFAGWKAGEVPAKKIEPVTPKEEIRLFLVDRPGSIQSTIIVGNLTVARNNPNEVGIEAFNNVLGGQFISRLNMNLREDKHWSYGAGTTILPTSRQRAFAGFTSVQTDKTAESLVEMDKEFRAILGGNLITQEELDRVQKNQVLALPGSWETIASVASSIESIVKYDLAIDYYRTYPKEVRELSLEKTHAAGPVTLKPGQLSWVVVGDLAKIQAGIEALGWGKVQLLDADGNPK